MSRLKRIPQKYTPEGKLDFHACRVAYINLVIESGVNLKEAQALARHATPELTMNVYGRVREARLAQAVEKVALTLVPDEQRATCVQLSILGTKEKSANPFEDRELWILEGNGPVRKEFEPSPSCPLK